MLTETDGITPRHASTQTQGRKNAWHEATTAHKHKDTRAQVTKTQKGAKAHNHEYTLTQRHRGAKTEGHEETQMQRRKDAKAHRHIDNRDAKSQKHSSSPANNHKCTAAQRRKHTKAQSHNGTMS